MTRKLEEYSKQGDTTKFKNTYNELKSFFERKIDNSKYDFKIYLQGSYGNDTNIEDESDVDIIIELTSIYYRDISALTEEEQKRYLLEHSPAKITLNDFKAHILNILNKTPRYSYEEKNKCVKITSGTPLNADIIVCAKHKKYISYYKYIEGIMFFDKNGNRIVSYPKQHSENMTVKNKLVPNFKPTVRIFKNLKNELINDGYIDEENISSYFVESMIFNIPDYYFTITDLKTRVSEIIINAIEFVTHEVMITPCRQKYLFGNGENQWTEEEAINFLRNAYIIVREQ